MERPCASTAILTQGLNRRHLDVGFPTFHELCQSLCDARMLYNVEYVSPDEPLTAERLSAYKNLVLPDIYSLPEGELDVIGEWMGQGGRAISLGKVDPCLAQTRFSYQDIGELKSWLLEAGTILQADEVEGLGIALHRRDGGYALHLVNYRLDPTSRVIEPIPWVGFDLNWLPQEARVHSFPACDTAACIEDDVLTVKNLGIYTIVELG